MATNKNFNFEDFSTSVLKTVDSIRSTGTSGAKNPVESRINAFYRAIGFPAINTDANVVVDPDNNGNIFDSKDLSISQADQMRMVSRETLEKTSSIDNDFDFSKNGLVDLTNKYFPLVVNNSIPIWEKKNRVGLAFSTDIALENDTIKYSRPLIESIISWRLTADGVSNLGAVRFVSAKEMEAIGKTINKNIIDSYNNIFEIVESSISSINNSRKLVGVDISPQENPQGNPKVSSNEDRLGELEIKKKNQNLILSLKKAGLYILDFDDTFGSGSALSRNVKGPLLSMDLFKMFAGTDSIESDIKETDSIINKQKKQIKIANRNLDFVYGTYSGFSLAYVMTVIKAMFDVSIETVISVLNENSRINLKNIRGVDYTTPPLDVKTALLSIQSKIQDNLSEMQENVKKIQYKNKVNKQKKPKN